jgi:rRNA maturation RNase YbeY
MEQAKEEKIHFHYLTTGFAFRNRRRLKLFLDETLQKEGKSVESVNYIFCDDRYLLELNRKFLNHNTYTDIITFELSPKGQPLIADIYISIDRVKENAPKFETPFSVELHRVIFHGMLHLCGYKDKSLRQAKLMREMEAFCLSTYFVSREKRSGKH